LDGLSLHIRFRNTPVEVVLEADRLTVAQAEEPNRSIRVGVGEKVREIKDGEGYTLRL